MSTQTKTLFTLFLLCCFTANAAGKELIREFKGSESRRTGEFEVEAPWILDWRATSDFPASMAMEVSLEEAGTGVHLGAVTTTKYIGNGVRLFNEGGRFQFRVNSSMTNWTLRVEQLTKAEAELYTPRNAEK